MTDITFLRVKQVAERTGLSRSTLYRMVNEGRFPKPVGLGERSIAWSSEAVAAWQRQRIEASEQAVQVDIEDLLGPVRRGPGRPRK